MFIRVNFAVLLEMETGEVRSTSLGAPGAGLALLPSPHHLLYANYSHF